MTRPNYSKRPQAVLDFKASLNARIALFETEPDVLPELAYLRSIRRTRWDASTDYYGNRKHYSIYRAMREAKDAGLPVPRWNSSLADTSNYPLKSRILIERESRGGHMMHKQLRRSISLVMQYLVDRCDMVSGLCLSVRKKRYRELFVSEIARATQLGRRTVQRALSNLSKHQYINRGVALIGITPRFYKAMGLMSAAKVIVRSLQDLARAPGYRGLVVYPEGIVPHRNYHRFNRAGATRPSVRRLVASLSLGTLVTSAPPPEQKVPRWNSTRNNSPPPPATGPPPSQPAARDKRAGFSALANLKQILND